MLRRQARRPTARRTMAASSMDLEPLRTTPKGEFSPSSEATEAENELMVSRTMPTCREHPVRMGLRRVELGRCFSGNALPKHCMQDRGCSEGCRLMAWPDCMLAMKQQLSDGDEPWYCVRKTAAQE